MDIEYLVDLLGDNLKALEKQKKFVENNINKEKEDIKNINVDIESNKHTVKQLRSLL